MTRIIDLTGKKFERLTVLCREDDPKKIRALWRCLCDCGRETILSSASIRYGNTKSCGCLKIEKVKLGLLARKHGQANKTTTYKSWKEMRYRCLSKKANYNRNWMNYGARGILICKRWLDSFQNFLEDMGERPEGTSLDRINVNGNYEPSNCRWANPRQQGQNQRTTKLTMEKANEIRERYKSGESGYKLADVYGVQNTTIYCIVNNKTWKN